MDRGRSEKTLLKNWTRTDFAGMTGAAKDRTRWKGSVVKSSLAPQRSCKFMECTIID